MLACLAYCGHSNIQLRLSISWSSPDAFGEIWNAWLEQRSASGAGNAADELYYFLRFAGESIVDENDLLLTAGVTTPEGKRSRQIPGILSAGPH